MVRGVRGLLGVAAATSILAAGLPSCAGRARPAEARDAQAVSVDVDTLWKKEAASDPIMAYRIRIASDPDNAALHNNLGNLYVFENKMDEAVKEFKVAATLDKSSPVPWNNIGTTYKKLGRLGDAHDAFRKAIDRDERYALAYYNIGTIYDQKGDYDSAIEYYLKAVALRPDLAQVKTNPQVVENRNLMVVQLRHFLEEAGNIALPLDRLPE